MSTEQELVALLYALYLWDCIRWLPPGQVAFVLSGKGWRRHQATTHSFTLLGRLPVLRSPLSMRPGLIVSGASEASELSARRVRATIRLLDRQTMWLSMLASVSATYLLLVLPVIALAGRFAMVWKPLTVAVLGLHLAVVVEFYRSAGRWRKEARKSFWEAFVASALNPLTALRATDQMMVWTLSRTAADVVESALRDFG